MSYEARIKVDEDIRWMLQDKKEQIENSSHYRHRLCVSMINMTLLLDTAKVEVIEHIRHFPVELPER